MPKGVDQCQICILTHMLKDSFDTGFQMEGLPWILGQIVIVVLDQKIQVDLI